MKKITKIKRNMARRELIMRVGFLILAVIFAFEIYQAYNYIPGVKEAVALATTVKPETFTELYFENHLALPAKITSYQEETFRFTVHNLEYKTMTYPYEVYIKCSDVGCNGDKQIIDEGEITLKQNEYKTISESYMINLPTGRIEIVANLINKNQQIDFWMEESK